ncbi:MAG: DUF2231 domain-containing protein [Rhodococcus sp. (in: high G+C Gram-positive bacteria)]|uniref:DUF2231 domain-containing protein n=1 Tax=Rhodococcus TaxID=1827 RepID=UPI001E2A6E63|nr:MULTISPECIES: DUF2231 domain-containing protein [Rhodococcus erythropolis group]MCD2104607.1 hypothetical protein [Rhodococcus qingshengii]MCZ4525267.1 hypothetical protein [Rhodococcus erythropolis]MDZ7913734.1 DUF2231 domain-containing protein [Rhodococcus sp. (in: high G+C Gram-positive bacteria)]
MGLTTIGGLPAHPLLVHLVVVLVPISALLLVLAVCWPAARIRLGLAPAVIALITLIAVPVTTDAGEWLEKQIPEDPLVQAHAELGDQMLFWSIGVFVLAATWWILHSTRFAAWRADPPDTSTSPKVWRVVVIAVAALSVLVAAGSVVQVYRIGESGAKAVWSDQLG